MKKFYNFSKKITPAFSVILIFILLISFSKVQSQVLVNITNINACLCHGDSTGSMTASPSGGTSPYTYTWNTTPTQAAATATNLPAGTYTVTVNDNVGNSATASATVIEPSALQISVTSTPVSCYGGSNGTVSATVTGGTPAYTYSWCNGNSISTATGLPAGSCTVTVTDANGCTDVQSTVITQPTQLNVAVTNIDSAICYGQCNGIATVTASGGTPIYTYLWNNGQTGSTASGLCASNFSVTVTDANGCTSSLPLTIPQPMQLIATIDTHFDSLLCFADSNGYATVNVTGGTFPWTFEWSTVPAQYTMTAHNLAAGIYSVTITDANGCTITLTTTVVQPPKLQVQADSLNEECLYYCNGQATSAVTGGTLPWTYQWYDSNGPISPSTLTLTDLCPDIYYLVVTDANGCTASDTTTVTAPENISIASFNVSAVTGNVPLDVNFTYTGTASSSNVYFWDFGDGATSNIENPSHTFTVADTFKVKLILANDVCSDTFSILINAGSTDCFAQFGIYPDSLILHHYYIVNMAAGVQPISYLWNWGDGSYDTIQYPSHTYSVAGFYNICLTITDNVSCSSSYCYSAQILKSPNSIFSVDVISPNTGIPVCCDISSDLSIFPNPVDDILYINNLQQSTNNIISVFNLQGQLVMHQPISMATNAIYVSHLTQGLYFLKLENDSGVEVRKFIKE